MPFRHVNHPCPPGLLAGILLIALAGGCANPYMKNYVSTRETDTDEESLAVLPSSGQPHLVTTQNAKADALNLRENGYILLGRSKFRSSLLDEKDALAQARKIGAEVVMVMHKFVNTTTESLPMSEYIPGQVTQNSEQTVIDDGKGKPKVVERYSTTVTEGEYHTTYVEQSTDYYDYSATYWAKAKPPVFGVHVKALDDATKSELGTNKGVLVRLAVKNSPAYEADILRGDVLLSFGGTEVRDPDQFFTLVKKYEGKKVPVLIYRSGQNLSVDVTLGTE
jgi:hypothetical protein